MLMGWLPEFGVLAVPEARPDRPDAGAVDGGCKTGVLAGATRPMALEGRWLMVRSTRKCRRSSAMSLAVE